MDLPNGKQTLKINKTEKGRMELTRYNIGDGCHDEHFVFIDKEV
jgi:hypothetical protein